MLLARNILSASFWCWSILTFAQNWTGAVDNNWNNPANWTDWPLDGEDIT